jgi:uncharacterized membrane protein
MSINTPEPMVRIGGHPILRILVSFPIACFCGALVTDIAYAWTADMMWANFSAWLLAAGMFMGVLAAIVGFVHLLAHRRARSLRTVFVLFIGSVAVLALAGFNNLVHSRDAWTSVVPLGLAISAITVVVMLITIWLGSGSVYRPVVGVQYSGVRQ